MESGHIRSQPIRSSAGVDFGDSQRLSIALERHYSIAEIVELWGLSEKTIRRIFSSEPGVVTWGHEEQRFKRAYKTLRVPESVLQRVHRRIRRAS
jgi:hypothetical protein